MNGFEEKNHATYKQPLDALESPFLTEELLAVEPAAELSPRVAALESPFLSAVEQGLQQYISVPELEEEFVQESSYNLEQEGFADDEIEDHAMEGLTDLRDEVEEASPVESFSSWSEEEDSDLEFALFPEELVFSEETASEVDEEETAYPLEEFMDLAEQFLDETLVDLEEPLPMLIPGAVEQNVQKQLSQGVFERSLLERFATGQIWNEDHIALEILYRQQPKLRPAQLDKASASERLKLLNWQAVKHAQALKPIREDTVRPIFGDPANFQIGSSSDCQVQDLREQVRKLGPIPVKDEKGNILYYKRQANRSPRDESKVNSIVLHHMAYNIGNNVTSYMKVGAHYIVTADGQVGQLYDDLDFMNASNNFNGRSVAIEFAGNFPRQDYHWWKNKERTIPDRCYLTPAQIRAGRCLLSTIKSRLPNIKYLYAHRQSSASRENDPGRDVWFNIGEWALVNLNLTDREPKLFEGNGQAIPAAWRLNRSASPKLPSIPSSGAARPPKPSAELTRFVQSVLNAAEGERLKVDGDFGKSTGTALERFRQKYNLGSGGLPDEKTQLALAQRVFEELQQRSMFPQLGVLDARTREELIAFKSQRLLGTEATIDAATRAALADASRRRTETSNSGSTVPKTQPVTSLNKELVVTADTLNVRAAPSLQSNVIGSLRKGQVVSLLESSSDGQWHKVRKDNLTGWSFHRYLTARTPQQSITVNSLPNLGAGLTPPTNPDAFRKFRLTTYYVVDQNELPASGVSVPIYDQNKNKIAEGSPAFFAKLSLEGTGLLNDKRLINVTGKTVPVSHDEYAAVLAYHQQAYAKRDQKRRAEGRDPTPTSYSGIVVQNNRIVKAMAFHEVQATKRGIGYGSQRGVPYVPFRTLAADIGYGKYPSVEKKWKDKGGVVPPGTHVYIKEFEGLLLPDGTRHDGWFIVNDTGGAIFGAHFDVFTGTLALSKKVKLPQFGTVWFEGIEQRVPVGYSYGLKP